MAVQADSGGKDDLKTQFITREGTYRLMTLSEYSRPNRVGYTNTQGSSQVRVSLVTLPPSSPDADTAVSDDRICFNYGKELYVYVYKGVKKAADLTKPVDKKIYKGTNPTCHDFNTVTTTPDSVSLLIGFSTGQIQILDPIKKEVSKLYNEERLIDKSRVTCIRWAPGSSNLFLAAHASGQLYVYNEELGCGAAAPHYQPFKQGDGFAVHTCKTKSTRNPLYRWVVGAEGCCINEFAFSPCGAHLAVASQDGFLRVFRYDTMELVGRARSYFGGFLCVCWSPDGRYAVAGGEDDLVTVWSLDESRVAARGQGHRSWVSVVAFDPYARLTTEREPRLEGEAEPATSGACYRLGSVSQDTQLCLWDITEDALRPPPKSRTSAHIPPDPGASSPNGAVGRPPVKCAKNNKIGSKPSETRVEVERGPGKPIKVDGVAADVNAGGRSPPSETAPPASVASRLAGFPFGDRKENSHRRNFSLASKGNSNAGEGKNSSISNSVALRVKSTLAGVSGGAGSTGGTGSRTVGDPLRLIGTSACPRFDDCPVLEPLVCKKVAHERLTALLFRRDCLVTACQDGGVYTWARPGLPPPPPPPRSLDASDLFERTDPPE